MIRKLIKILENNNNEVVRNDIIEYSKTWIPELYKALEIEHENPHHHETIGNHMLSVLFNVKNETKNINMGNKESLELQIAALLHDIGKPNCKKYDKKAKKYRYIGHDVESAKLAFNILKFISEIDEDNAQISIDNIIELIILHMTIHDKCDDASILFRLEPYRRRELLILMKADIDAHVSPNYEKYNRVINVYNSLHLKEKDICEYWNLEEEMKIEQDSKLSIINVGVSRSGKSTISNILLGGFIKISADDIRKRYFNVKFDSSIEEKVWDIHKSLLRNISGTNKNIVIDNTNLTVKVRKKHLSILKKENYSTIFFFYRVGISTLIRRADKDGISKDVIFNMYKALQYPVEDMENVYIIRG